MNKDKIRYAILKTLEEGKNPFEILVNKKVTREIILKEGNFLSREKYITKNHYADNTIYYWGVVTEKGEDYLKERSKFGKAYNLAKEIRDWLPFFSSK